MLGRLVVQFPQQGPLPFGPRIGRNSRQVGVRNQVERPQPFLVGEQTGELGDHLVVVEIAPPRNHHHVLVVLHEEAQHGSFLLVQPHPLAQFLGHLNAACDVVVALPLAHIVQEHREKQQIAARTLGEDIRHAPLLLTECFQIFQRNQRVLINRVDVVNVVLDQAGQPLELG